MKKILFILIVSVVSTSIAQPTKTIVCNAPHGTRIDYFSKNVANLQNETFIMGRDSVSDIKPTIIFEGNQQDVTFILTNPSDQTATKKGTMKILMSNDEQISFAGIFYGAPLLVTYYPKIHILIYSQQSVWPGGNFAGARAVIFYAKCEQ